MTKPAVAYPPASNAPGSLGICQDTDCDADVAPRLADFAGFFAAGFALTTALVFVFSTTFLLGFATTTGFFGAGFATSFFGATTAFFTGFGAAFAFGLEVVSPRQKNLRTPRAPSMTPPSALSSESAVRYFKSSMNSARCCAFNSFTRATSCAFNSLSRATICASLARSRALASFAASSSVILISESDCRI